jgi:hypothetical protein
MKLSNTFYYTTYETWKVQQTLSIHTPILNNHFNIILCKKSLQKVLMLYLVVITGLLGMIQYVYGQSSSLQDSLKQQLTYIEANTKDTALRKAVKEAQSIYTGGMIDDSVSKKLLIVDSRLVNNPELNRQIVIAYAQTLMQLFKELPPKQEHPDYASDLNNLALLCRQPRAIPELYLSYT